MVGGMEGAAVVMEGKTKSGKPLAESVKAKGMEGEGTAVAIMER